MSLLNSVQLIPKMKRITLNWCLILSPLELIFADVNASWTCLLTISVTPFWCYTFVIKSVNFAVRPT